MKNENPSKLLYETYYRLLRRGVPAENWTTWGHKLNEEVHSCALETIDYHDSEFTGWINRQRYHQFRVLQSGLFNRSELPF